MRGGTTWMAAVFAAAFVLGFSCNSKSTTAELTEQLVKVSAENERLRLFNAREARRHKIHKGARAEGPSDEILNMARHITGVAPEAVLGVYLSENGPPDIETGVLGKTDFFAKCLPMQYWPAVEAGRTLNIHTWNWLTKTKEGRVALRKVLAYTAGPYTQVSPERQKRWVQTVLSAIEKQPK